MDLYSGQPWWIIKNPLWDYYNPLGRNIRKRVAVVGSGITGALVAHELCEAGIECCVIDKRSPSTGSSVASTALLQYEIDIPLYQMAEKMPVEDAVIAYHSCLQSIGELESLLKKARVDAGFTYVPSVYYASNHKGMRELVKEYEMRTEYGFPAKLLRRKELKTLIGIDAPGALANHVSAQVDTYRAATGLLGRHIKRDDLELYTHTEITGWEKMGGGYILRTAQGNTIECEYVVIATGFEAMPFLPEKLMDLTTTFAIISEPVDEKYIWYGKSLLWETRQPYLYIRTDDRNRIIVGGEDIPYNSTAARKFLLDKKAGILESKFRKLFPSIPFVTEMSWAGTFSSTKDGLPLIGPAAGDPNMLFALGYGGNGITFSVIAAQILSKYIGGVEDSRAHVFGLERESLK